MFVVFLRTLQTDVYHLEYKVSNMRKNYPTRLIPPKKRFSSSWNSLYFPAFFSQRKLRIHAIRRDDGKQFTAKVCSLHLL